MPRWGRSIYITPSPGPSLECGYGHHLCCLTSWAFSLLSSALSSMGRMSSLASVTAIDLSLIAASSASAQQICARASRQSL